MVEDYLALELKILVKKRQPCQAQDHDLRRAFVLPILVGTLTPCSSHGPERLWWRSQGHFLYAARQRHSKDLFDS
jgi:hypothetical protein